MMGLGGWRGKGVVDWPQRQMTARATTGKGSRVASGVMLVELACSQSVAAGTTPWLRGAFDDRSVAWSCHVDLAVASCADRGIATWRTRERTWRNGLASPPRWACFVLRVVCRDAAIERRPEVGHLRAGGGWVSSGKK